jgi:threonine aldolase
VETVIRTVVADLRSDTVTKPDEEMRRVIAAAEVGDHVLGDDPTAAELEEYVADLLGKDAALFFPSGIMANQTAILTQTSPGMEILLDSEAHILNYEEAAASAWAGVQTRGVVAVDGLPVPERFAAAIGEPSPHRPVPGLLCLENTHNGAGGRLMSVELMGEIAALARTRGIPVHLDGARLPNASVAAERPMRDWARLADTVMVSLSKGLGAPIGSMLAGDRRTMDTAIRVRRRLGGGMRQVGLLAAAGLHALHHNFERLADDHSRAATFARRVDELPGLAARQPDTNIVMIEIDPGLGTAGRLAGRLERLGVRTVVFGPGRIRAVFHNGIDDLAVERAVQGFAEAVRDLSPGPGEGR